MEKLKVCGEVASFCEGFAVEVVFLKFFGVCEVLTDWLLDRSLLKEVLFVARCDLLSFHEKDEKQPFKSSCASCC